MARFVDEEVIDLCNNDDEEKEDRSSSSGSIPRAVRAILEDPDPAPAGRRREGRSKPPGYRRYRRGDRELQSRARGWCITTFNTDEWELATANNTRLPEGAIYGVWQLERTRSGRRHYQLYLYFKNPITLLGAKERDGLQSAHLAIARGTAQENRDYCTKEDTRIGGPWEIGVMPQQGKRTDLHELAADIKEAKGDLASVIQKETNAAMLIRYSKGAQAYAALCRETQAERPLPFVVYIWGPTEVGKSTLAFAMARGGDGSHTYVSRFHANWSFDGYNNEPLIIFEEFDGRYPITQLLGVLDTKPYQLQQRGTTTPLLASYFIFTSNLPPDACYPYGTPHHEAWMRRINDGTVINVETKMHAQTIIAKWNWPTMQKRAEKFRNKNPLPFMLPDPNAILTDEEEED